MPTDHEITILALQKSLTDTERLQFQSEYNARQKSITASVLLAFCLGGLGAHRFYLNQIGWGIGYLLLCRTLIPSLVACVECFLMADRVRRYNYRTAENIVNSMKMISALSKNG